MTLTLPADLGRHADKVTLGPKARALLAYWHEKSLGKAMPARRDMPVADLAAFLPNLVFVDRLLNPDDFRFRLIGSDIVHRMLLDRTGHRFSDTPAMAEGSKFWRRYDWVARHGQPLFSEVDYVGHDANVRICQDLILPFADDVPGGVGLMTLVMFIGFGQV